MPATCRHPSPARSRPPSQKKQIRLLPPESFSRSRAIMKSDNRRDILPEFPPEETPAGVDRRAFLMRSALVGSVAVLTGAAIPKHALAAPYPQQPALSP